MNQQQLRKLKRQCHHLKPVIWIGQKGLSDNVFDEIESALGHHELIKIKIASADKASRQEMVSAICDRTHSDLIQSIGHMVSFYRKNPDNPKPTM